MKRFDRVVHAFERPKVGSALLGLILCVSLLGLAGCLSQSLFLGATVWIVTGLFAGGVVVRRRQLVAQAHRSEIAARADRENDDYLAGRPSGIHGRFDPA